MASALVDEESSQLELPKDVFSIDLVVDMFETCFEKVQRFTRESEGGRIDLLNLSLPKYIKGIARLIALPLMNKPPHTVSSLRIQNDIYKDNNVIGGEADYSLTYDSTKYNFLRLDYFKISDTNVEGLNVIPPIRQKVVMWCLLIREFISFFMSTINHPLGEPFEISNPKYIEIAVYQLLNYVFTNPDFINEMKEMAEESRETVFQHTGDDNTRHTLPKRIVPAISFAFPFFTTLTSINDYISCPCSSLNNSLIYFTDTFTEEMVNTEPLSLFTPISPLYDWGGAPRRCMIDFETRIPLLIGKDVTSRRPLMNERLRINAVLLALNKKHQIEDTFFTTHADTRVSKLSPEVAKYFGITSAKTRVVNWRTSLEKNATRHRSLGGPRSRLEAIRESTIPTGGSASGSTGRKRVTRRHRHSRKHSSVRRTRKHQRLSA